MNGKNLRYFYLAALVISGSYTHASSVKYDEKSFFELQKVNYANEVREETNNADSIGIDFNKSFQNNEFSGKADIKGKFFLNNENPAYSLKEAYIEYKSENKKIRFGRQILDWNENEEFWYLGHLNGLSNINFLDRDREGLFGINFQYKTGRIKLEGFLSYFYLPSLNPSLDIQDGKVVNNGSWGRTPPKTTAIAGVRTPIIYDLNRPNNSDVVFKKSLGGRLTFLGDDAETSLYAMYKPENTLRINAIAYANLDATVSAIANPLVNHHGIFGASIQFGRKKLQWKNSFQVVDPNTNLAGDFEVVDPFKLKQDSRQFSSEFFTVSPNYQKQSYVTSQLSYVLPDQEIGIHGIYLVEGRDALGDDFLSDAPRWHAAAGISAMFRYHYRWLARGSFQYDLQRQDQLLNFHTSYFLTRGTSIGFGGKLLRSPEVQSFWYSYRAEDQIYMNLQQFF